MGRNPRAHMGCCTQNTAETTFHLLEHPARGEQGLEAAKWTVPGLFDLYTASPEPTEFSSRLAHPPLLSSASSSFLQPPALPPPPCRPPPEMRPSQLTLPLDLWSFQGPTVAGCQPPAQPGSMLAAAWAEAHSGLPSPQLIPVVLTTERVLQVDLWCFGELNMGMSSVFKLVMKSDPTSTIRTLS